MFASRAYQDVVSLQNCGLPPGLYAAGSTAGTAMQYSEFRKLAFTVNVGSVGSVNAQFGVAIQTASASNATFTTVFGTGYSAGSAGGVTGSFALLAGSLFSNSSFILDTRGEAVYSAVGAQSMSAAPWIRALISVSNSTIIMGVGAHGYLHEFEPAYNYAGANYQSSQNCLWY